MYKTIFNKRNSLKFNRFSNKSYSLFAVLGREVLVGALSVATLSHAKAAGVSTEGAKVDSTLYKGGKAYELDAVSVTGSRAPMTVEQSPKIVSVITRDDIHRGCADYQRCIEISYRRGCPSAWWLWCSDGYLHQWWNL